jgi:hypothetical protein
VPLSTGDKLGPYEILAFIGAGGMGEVYKARDSRLDRLVAIKVLPTALARDPDRAERFAREAKALASLNHPNIAQIYGIEESGAWLGVAHRIRLAGAFLLRLLAPARLVHPTHPPRPPRNGTVRSGGGTPHSRAAGG